MSSTPKGTSKKSVPQKPTRSPIDFLRKKSLGKAVNFRLTKEQEAEYAQIVEELRAEDASISESDVYRGALDFYLTAWSEWQKQQKEDEAAN